MICAALVFSSCTKSDEEPIMLNNSTFPSSAKIEQRFQVNSFSNNLFTETS